MALMTLNKCLLTINKKPNFSWRISIRSLKYRHSRVFYRDSKRSRNLARAIDRTQQLFLTSTYVYFFVFFRLKDKQVYNYKATRKSEKQKKKINGSVYIVSIPFLNVSVVQIQANWISAWREIFLLDRKKDMILVFFSIDFKDIKLHISHEINMNLSRTKYFYYENNQYRRDHYYKFN